MSADAADLTHLLALAERLAADAAALLVDGLSRARASVDTKSTGTDMVTEMDRASERLIVEGLRAARPDDGILGEEGTDHAGTTGVRWVVDPLDGTTNYLYAHAGFAVSIGVQVDGATVAGVVHDPLHADVFTATLGGGAFRNGRPIVASAETDLSRALVATGFSYQPERRELQAAVLTRILPKVRDIRRMGAASVDLCSVAHGRADAYYERGLQPWDHVAGALVATGGRRARRAPERRAPRTSTSSWPRRPRCTSPCGSCWPRPAPPTPGPSLPTRRPRVQVRTRARARRATRSPPGADSPWSMRCSSATRWFSTVRGSRRQNARHSSTASAAGTATRPSVTRWEATSSTPARRAKRCTEASRPSRAPVPMANQTSRSPLASITRSRARTVTSSRRCPSARGRRAARSSVMVSSSTPVM